MPDEVDSIPESSASRSGELLPVPAGQLERLPGETLEGDISVADRLHYSLGPLAGGIILDITDFVTFGPIGLVLGVAIGAPVGWWVASIYGFSKPTRFAIALASGIYCSVPGTELIPLATMISAAARYYSAPTRKSPAGSQEG